MMANRLIALDKQPGTRPVGIGEIYRRLWAKCLLKAIGSQATAACGNHNLCAGLQAGIEGAIHAVRSIFSDPSLLLPKPPNLPHSPTNPPPSTPPLSPPLLTPPNLCDLSMDDAISSLSTAAGNHDAEATAVLLVDATNGFNELGRKAMLWTVRHRWANGARFSFNCYRHSAQLILRRHGSPCTVLHSREGVTQGDPLSMILYGLSLTPLAEALRTAIPQLAQPWYADDAAMIGAVSAIAKAQRLLLQLGPRRGYFPEPEKSVLITPVDTPSSALTELHDFHFQRSTGHRYLGGFVGAGTDEANWIDPQISKWIEGVQDLSMVATRYPQSAYAGFTKSLQAEWQYVQRVTPHLNQAFAPLELAIAQTFLPALLNCTIDEAAHLRPLIALPVRQGGLGILDPTKTSDHCYSASTAITSLLTDSLVNNKPLCAMEHRRTAAIGRQDAKTHLRLTNEDVLFTILAAAKPMEKRRITRSADTGAWLTTLPTLLNGSDLSADEFRDGARLRLGLTPTALPPQCDGCGERFTTDHAMSCRKGGLIIHRHNDLVTTWGQLCGQALTPSTVTDEPLIQPSRDTPMAETTQTVPAPELRGDLAVHGFWTKGQTAIFDVRITDTDQPSNCNTNPSKVLLRHEKEKKDKYGALCIARRRTFTPLVFSVDGLLGKEATAASKRLASCLAAKWKRSYSELCGYVRSRLSLALIRSSSRCLKADRNPTLRFRTPTWDSGTGLGIYRM
jgi:hypothetical protein